MFVDKAAIEDYKTHLKDKRRTPSRGGNKRAYHQHIIVIDGEKYAFLAPWSGKFVYNGEMVSFEWEWDSTNKYRNIKIATVVAWTKTGKQVLRGERGFKPWREATTRAPGKRRELSD